MTLSWASALAVGLLVGPLVGPPLEVVRAQARKAGELTGRPMALSQHRNNLRGPESSFQAGQCMQSYQCSHR